MRLVRTVAVVLSCLVVFPVLAANEREILLRTPPVTPGGGKEEVDPKVRRARFVDVNAAPLLRGAMGRGERKEEVQLLSVTLFPEVTYDVKLTHVERTPIDSVAWSGVVEGETLSSVLFSLVGNTIHGSISVDGKRYAIESTKHGMHRVTELDLAQFPEELPPQVLPFTGVQEAAVVRAQDAGTRIDVLVAYTTTVRTVLGSTAAAQALATNSVNATNTAYANSGVTPRLRLVGTIEVAHSEATDFGTTLSQLRSTNDGQMDTVHPLRESLGADAVALIVDKTGACGIGYVMTFVSTGFASSAFSVTDYSCAVDNLSFPHELGHNFGLAHDRLNGSQASSNYSYGYQDPQGGFRDIMAYPNGCPGFCPRIQYFSNPDITYLNRPLGVNHLLSTAADNRRALNENAFSVANFRQEVNTPTPVTFTDDPLVAGATRVKALHVTELRTAINTKRTQAGLGAFAWSAAPASGGPILATQVAELRTALTPALAALGTTASYTDPTLTVDVTRIKAVHIQELRNYVK